MLEVKLVPPTVKLSATELIFLHDTIEVIAEVPVTVRAGSKVKLVALVPTPDGVVTRTTPEVPEANTAVIEVSLFTVKELTAVPPMVTVVAPVKEVPVIVMLVPTGPLEGVNEVIVGGKTTMLKLVEAVKLPKLLVNEIGPEVAPTGIVAEILVLST